jgi:cysteine-rich repeat protein
MYCGSTSRSGAQLYSGVGTFNEVTGCSPTANTQALLITRSGAISGNGPAWLAYLNAGGRIVTEWSVAAAVYNEIYGTVYPSGAWFGYCLDNAMPEAKLNPMHPFWVANAISQTPSGMGACGYDLANLVSGEPLVTPLGTVAGAVSFAARSQGAGWLFLLEADWQDIEPYFTSDSQQFMGALIGACPICDNDGLVDDGEQCDDGNLDNGDGCSSACLVEPCYTCSGEPSSCSALPDASACDDGLFCNGTDQCVSALCTVHTGDPCTGGLECNAVCSESNNTCAEPPSTPCTSDGNECTADRCDGLGACIHPASPYSTPCTPDSNDCTDDVCDGAGACFHPDSYYTACDDGEFCNGSDLCYAGSCSYHYGDPCTFVVFNTVCHAPTHPCTPSPPGSLCYDVGEACTSDECDGAGTCAFTGE